MLLILIVVAVGAYYAGQQHALNKYFPNSLDKVVSQVKNVVPTVVPTLLPTATNKTPEVAITAFYNSYITCIKNPPAEAKSNVSSYCLIDTGLTASDFASKSAAVTGKAGVDTVICNQNPPQGIEVGSATTAGNGTAVVSVTTTYNSGLKIVIPVTLKKENNEWKIASIQCPK